MLNEEIDSITNTLLRPYVSHYQSFFVNASPYRLYPFIENALAERA